MTPLKAAGWKKDFTAALKKTLLTAVAVSACGFGLAACSSFQGEALDAMQAFSGEGRQEAFVEAYIEFGSGDGRWAAPQSVLLHVDAGDGELARIELGTHLDLIRGGGSTPRIGIAADNRGPASVEARAESAEASAEKPAAAAAAATENAVTFSAEEAREQMARLSLAMEQDAGKAAKGCLFPIRARLVKADGGIVDREGCRGQRGWNRTASEVAERWLSLSMRQTLSQR